MNTVDVVLYDGVDELDFCGPYEVLASCRRLIQGKWSEKPVFHVETVAEYRSPVQCAHGLHVLPDKTLAQAFEADIIIVPGGPGARKPVLPPHLIEFLRKSSDTAEIMASVSTGTFVLAKAGLIDNRQVTTHPSRLDELAKAFPSVRVTKGQRIVIDGKEPTVMSAAGISAGVDLALAIILRYEGRETAEFAARRLSWPGRL